MLTQEEIIRNAGLQYSTPESSKAGALGNLNNTNIVSNDYGSDVFMQELQKRLISQSDMISSANTNIEEKINKAIGGITTANEASKAAITSQYDRQIGYTAEKQNNAITASLERGVGMQTTDVAYRAMAKEADQNLKDLEQRKQELILQGDAASASKIADLQIQTLDFKTKSMQQTFSNLLSLSNFGLQMGQEKRAQRAQSFQEQSALSNIALQYGVKVNPGDTLDSVVNRALPFANKKQQAELAKIYAETNRLNAEAAKAARGEGSYDMGNPTDLYIMELLAVNDPTLFKQMIAKDKNLAKALPGGISKEAQKIEQSTYERLKRGETFENISAESTPVLDAESAMKAQLKALEKYKSEITSTPKKPSSTLRKDIGSGIESLAPVGQSVIDYLELNKLNPFEDYMTTGVRTPKSPLK